MRNVRSIQTKTTLLTVCAVIASLTIATIMGAVAIRDIGKSDSDQLLTLLCESGEKNLDSYFESVAQSVQMVSAYVESDLEGLAPNQLDAHLERAKDIFTKMTNRTNGVLTYYYRIDPEVSNTSKGFWFVNTNNEGFKEHEVTDITQYDTSDTTKLVWFTVPKSTGEPVWLSPYITENLGTRVISYNVPVYWRGRFIGVIGIEIDYATVATQVRNITLYENGYAFLVDETGKLVYHPLIDFTALDEPVEVPPELMSENSHIRYVYEGVKKVAVWLPLSNGMRLYVSVPVAEVDAAWVRLIWRVCIASVVLLLVFIFITIGFTKRITKPLQELTEVAEHVNEGDYSCELSYNRDDEIGTLTAAFKKLMSHLGVYIKDLNDRAYADALTSVRNKGAYDVFIQDLQASLHEQTEEPKEFGVCIFDCNDLKTINDQDGHDKGDLYLKGACAIICDVFDHSPVFRLGGDEFVVILRGSDFGNRDYLIELFDETCAKRREQAQNPWERIDVARGLAVYDPDVDDTVSDVVRRADKLMYEDKWSHKSKR
ncbi:MAG: diguanylate cyclase [Coriobacteriales bacterium]|nr:diguanylate cyclase [Coriobacteriales bacterium]